MYSDEFKRKANASVLVEFKSSLTLPSTEVVLIKLRNSRVKFQAFNMVQINNSTLCIVGILKVLQIDSFFNNYLIIDCFNNKRIFHHYDSALQHKYI